MTAKNRATVISVRDGSWRVCGRAIGTLSVDLPQGIYKVVAELNRDTWTELVSLRDEPVTVEVPELSFKSMVPMVATTRSHESHYHLMLESRGRVDVEVGKGTRIFLMSRNWSRSGTASQAPPRVRLERWRGDVIAEVSESGARLTQGDSAAACSVAVSPGAYVVSIDTSDGPISQAVYAVAGWESQVFVLSDFSTVDTSTPSGSAAPTVSVTQALVAGTQDHARSYQLIEIARTALAEKRVALGESIMDEIAYGKFEDPILGLMAGHILLISEIEERTQEGGRTNPASPSRIPLVRFDEHRYRMIVQNTARFFGETQPDILALRTKFDGWRPTDAEVSTPPIFHRSWELLLEASKSDMPKLLPGSLWRRVRGITNRTPYFSWMRAASPVAAQMRLNEKKVAKNLERAAMRVADIVPSLESMQAVGARPITASAKPVASELAGWAPPRADIGDLISPTASVEEVSRQVAERANLPYSVAEAMVEKESLLARLSHVRK